MSTTKKIVISPSRLDFYHYTITSFLIEEVGDKNYSTEFSLTIDVKSKFLEVNTYFSINRADNQNKTQCVIDLFKFVERVLQNPPTTKEIYNFNQGEYVKE